MNYPQIRNWVLGATLATSAVVGGAAIAGATTTHAAHKVATKSHAGIPHQHGTAPLTPPRGPRPTPLTGTDLASASAAALAAEPGASVVFAEKGHDGTSAFEVHLRKSDGSPVTVLLDANFTVTGTETGFGPRPGDHDGPPPFGDPATLPHGPGETLLTGTDLTSATSAALAAEPGATVLRAETNTNGSPYEVHVKKADGTFATVLLDANFTVTSTEAGFGHHPGGPDGPPPAGPDGGPSI